MRGETEFRIDLISLRGQVSALYSPRTEPVRRTERRIIYSHLLEAATMSLNQVEGNGPKDMTQVVVVYTSGHHHDIMQI